jgi:hypothetical protein
VLAAREARRLDPRRTLQAVDLEAGVLAEDPDGGIDRSSELGLRSSVLVVRRSLLGRVLVSFERLDRPAVQGGTKLTELARVLRREPCD